MQPDFGKLFIGGISWETNEDRLREYFQGFGEVVEAVIMKDRTTGRARGFGFVVFADPAVAQAVVLEKHAIDGRVVEAKKAVPREDQNILNGSNASVHGSPGPSRTKKIFVGGLPSTITDADFKKYFEQFGSITDAVVMYDHNTHRPRGFGFITFESEDSVDKSLLKTFHEINGKMVEVKRAVPKELSPGPGRRSPTISHSYGLNRISSFLNGYTQGYNLNPIGRYGIRMDVDFGPVANSRNGFPSLGPGYGMGMNFEPGFSSSYGSSSNYNNSVGYGRGLSSYYSGNSSQYNSPVGYVGSNINSGSLVGSMFSNVWGNGGPSYSSSSANSNAFLTSGNGGIGSFSSDSINWDGPAASASAQGGGSASEYTNGDLGFAIDDSVFDFVGGGVGRNAGTGSSSNSFSERISGFEGSRSELYGSSSIYGDPTWWLGSSDIDGSRSFDYGLRIPALDIMPRGSTEFVDEYNLSNSQRNRGIAP